MVSITIPAKFGKHGRVLMTEGELDIPIKLWYLKARGINLSRWVEDLIKAPWSRRRGRGGP